MNRSDFKSQYLSFLQKMGLNPTQALVYSAGSMLMHSIELRSSTEDIDLTLSAEDFDRLHKHLFEAYPDAVDVPRHWSGKHVVEIGVIDVHRGHNGDTLDGTLVDGVYCQRLFDVLCLKRSLDRPKDQRDIQNLERYLRKHGDGTMGQEFNHTAVVNCLHVLEQDLAHGRGIEVSSNRLMRARPFLYHIMDLYPECPDWKIYITQLVKEEKHRRFSTTKLLENYALRQWKQQSLWKVQIKDQHDARYWLRCMVHRLLDDLCEQPVATEPLSMVVTAA